MVNKFFFLQNHKNGVRKNWINGLNYNAPKLFTPLTRLELMLRNVGHYYPIILWLWRLPSDDTPTATANNHVRFQPMKYLYHCYIYQGVLIENINLTSLNTTNHIIRSYPPPLNG